MMVTMFGQDNPEVVTRTWFLHYVMLNKSTEGKCPQKMFAWLNSSGSGD